MKFQCFVCDDKNPCNLVTKYIGDVPPTLCPFSTTTMAKPDWKEVKTKGAKNTEQANQPDYGQARRRLSKCWLDSKPHNRKRLHGY